MGRYDEMGLKVFTRPRLSWASRVGQDVSSQYTPVSSQMGWRDYAGPGWYVVAGPPQGLGLVIKDTSPDADGFYRSTKIKLLPGTRVEVVNSGSKPGRAVVSRFSTNGQIQEIGSDKIGYIRRLNYEGYVGQQLLVRQEGVSTVSGFNIGQLAPIDEALGPVLGPTGFSPAARRRGARTVSQRFSGYTQPGWYRLSRPKRLKIHTRSQSVYGVQEIFAERRLPAGTMVELNQARNVLPPTAYAPAIVESGSGTFVSSIIADGKIYRLDDSTIGYFSNSCPFSGGVTGGVTFSHFPQFVPSAPLGEFTKSATQVTVPVYQPPQVAVPFAPPAQTRPGIAMPSQLAAVPQNGLPTSRLTRFSGVSVGQGAPSRGFNGPGIYRVTSPLGLTLHQGTSRQSFGYGKSKPGWTLEVLRDAGNGWFEVRGDIEWFKWENPPSGHPMQRRDNPTTMGYVAGYVCGSCNEHSSGPGPWLVKISQDPAPAPAPYIPQYRVPVSYAVPGLRPTLTSRARVGQLPMNRFQPISRNIGPVSRGGIQQSALGIQRLVSTVWNDKLAIGVLVQIWDKMLKGWPMDVQPEYRALSYRAWQELLNRFNTLPPVPGERYE